MTESTLTLEVAGRSYEVPQPTARVGLALQASWAVTHALRLKRTPPPYAVERMARYDSQESDIDEDSLGPVWDQMIEDEIGVLDLRRAAMAAYTWICTGKESIAQRVLNPDAKGEDEGPKA